MARKEFVYFISKIVDGKKLIKIGRSYNPNKRLFQLRMEATKDFKIENTILCQSFDESCVLELNLHNKFKNARLDGEWFILTEEIKKHLELLND